MNRSQAEKIAGKSYHSVNTLNAASQIQAAESLNEIAQFTVRDRFAGLIMQGLLSSHQCYPLGCSFDEDDTAERAYRYADAMLKARGK